VSAVTHANTTITMLYYSHCLPVAEQEAANVRGLAVESIN